MRTAKGFTLIELLIATALTLAVTASALALAGPAQITFRTQLETIDVTQRLRAAVDAVTRDFLRAGSGLAPGVPALIPPDGSVGPGGSPKVRYVSSDGVAVELSYYVRIDPETSVYELRRSDGSTDVPAVDHVRRITFSCFDGLGTLVASCADASRVRRVHIALAVQPVMSYMRTAQSSLHIRDEEVVIDVSPRMLQRSE